jgi:hypothetical protein
MKNQNLFQVIMIGLCSVFLISILIEGGYHFIYHAISLIAIVLLIGSFYNLTASFKQLAYTMLIPVMAVGVYTEWMFSGKLSTSGWIMLLCFICALTFLFFEHHHEYLNH